MLPQLLLLLALLGPGCGLPLGDPWRNGAKAAPGPVPARIRRQVALDEEQDEDYFPVDTDPPETLGNHTRVLGADTEPLTATTTLGQGASAGPGTPDPATVDAATGGSVSPRAGHSAGGTQWGPVSAGWATELTSATVSTVVAPTTDEILSTGPTATETETIQPASTEAQTMPPAATEAETMQPAATEAKATHTAATGAEAAPPVATEAKITRPPATEVLTTKPMGTEAVSTEAPSTVALSTEPGTTKSQSTEPPATLAAVFRGKDAPQNTLEAASSSPGTDWKAGQGVPAVSSVAPSPTGALERIPVRQCLLAILILALVATVFLVCTVVLAVRLSRRSHTYPVRSYSPTEMVCISSLLPDAGEGAPAVANGGLPRGQCGKAEPLEDHDGDNLTLHSFLP
ncbi:PREDICTED: P-selectin glycoprotein ligand 1 [Dipodomys ordii]|uniref:P-selectin glycoprotein ligand 1 n=1 Tax=Dipodomys ordii TaxID=10020 RepID=A0A1S3F1N5_DIPOR|nr:PREDICTED: P-selectin glycoprotein ligand 1 [Dipodomys ordii]